MVNYYNQLNGNIENDVSLFSGGLNSFNDKAFIDTNQMPYTFNMGMYKPPMMCTRAARKSLTKLSALSSPSIIIAMWARDEYGAIIVTRTPTLGVQRLWYVYKDIDENWEEVEIEAPHMPRNKQIYFCYCKTAVEEYLYLGNDSYKAKFELNSDSTYLANSFEEIMDDHYGIPCWHKGRLFLTNPSNNTITYSALYDYDNFTDVPDVPDPTIDYSSYAGDFFVTNAVGKLTRAVSFDDRLVIFAEHSMHMLYGDTPLITSSSQFQLVDLNNNLGCREPLSIAIGGGYLYWMGDDANIYSYSGSSIDTISMPMSSRYVTRAGGINREFLSNCKSAIATATTDKYYIQVTKYYDYVGDLAVIYVYDTKSHVWWMEDGDMTAMTHYRTSLNNILLATRDLEILETTDDYGGCDELRNDSGEKELVAIPYEFHTKVYGADGVDSRKSISEVWFQASADAEVFLTDSWTSTSDLYPITRVENTSDKKIGTLSYKGEKRVDIDGYLRTYNEDDYEQQVCYVQKMYGQRVNTFQIKVRGEGPCKFFLMKRKWDAR